MDFTTQIGALVTIIVGICESIKYAIGDSRWIPLLSVVLALIGSYCLTGFSFLSTAAGVILGLSTTGGYTLIKKSIFNQ